MTLDRGTNPNRNDGFYPDEGGGPAPGAAPATGPCPPGQERHPTRGDCRYTGDYPCPPGLCKDVVTKQCRTFNANREKVNETDTTERETGGGRGYCRQLDGGGGGGGGMGGGMLGGGGGGAMGAGGLGGGGGPFGAGSPGANANRLFGETGDEFNTIWNQLLPIAKGERTRYNDETMGMLEGRARADTMAQRDVDTRAVEEDAITRGMGRSGPTSEAVARVVSEGSRTYANTVTALRVKKVEQDFEDRMSALDRMQKALDSRQAYIIGLDTNAAGRERAIAEIALGYARIAAERQMLQLRLQTDLEIARTRTATDILLGGGPN